MNAKRHAQEAAEAVVRVAAALEQEAIRLRAYAANVEQAAKDESTPEASFAYVGMNVNHVLTTMLNNSNYISAVQSALDHGVQASQVGAVAFAKEEMQR